MWCVRWYLRYPISVAQMVEMSRERGLAISPSCVCVAVGADLRAGAIPVPRGRFQRTDHRFPVNRQARHGRR